MPDDLHSAHASLDRVVDKVFSSKRLHNDQDRIECLVEKYALLLADSIPSNNN